MVKWVFAHSFKSHRTNNQKYENVGERRKGGEGFMDDELARKRAYSFECKNHYRELKNSLQDEWRERIFKRDDYRCQACGFDEVEFLNLAHITSTRTFLMRSNLKDMETSMRDSYSEDNLITLCSTCHRCQHGQISSTYDDALNGLLARKKELEEIAEVKEYIQLKKYIGEKFEGLKRDAHDRKLKVDRLFRKIKKERGWNSGYDFYNLKKTGLTKIELYEEYDRKRLEIIKKHNLQETPMKTSGKTIWSGSSLPLHFDEEGNVVAIRFYSNNYRHSAQGKDFFVTKEALDELEKAYKWFIEIREGLK